MKQTWVKPNIIFGGTRIKQFKVGQMIFLDSSCYIQEKLRTFTETFDVKTVKGYFPHKFNVSENWDYVGVIPNKKYFLQEDVETSDFIAWYERQRCKGAVWDFQKKF